MGKVLNEIVANEVMRVKKNLQESLSYSSLLKNTRSEYYSDIMVWIEVQRQYLFLLEEAKNYREAG